MAKGICAGRSCRKIFDIQTTVGLWEICPYCDSTNLREAAIGRYLAIPCVQPCDGPTPYPKMDAACKKPDDPAQAFKSDAGKVQFDLLEDGAPNALLEIAKVMTWAVEVKGYHPHSWQEIPDAIRRYKAALARHRNAIARGEVLDHESGLLHWAHAACCVIFITELELRSKQP